MKDGIVCRQYTPGPNSDRLLVPIIPKLYQRKVLYQCHDALNAGHVGQDTNSYKDSRTWLLGGDVNQYCRECITCQSSKPPALQKAPLISIPIGKPWEMVVVDIYKSPSHVTTTDLFWLYKTISPSGLGRFHYEVKLPLPLLEGLWKYSPSMVYQRYCIQTKGVTENYLL